MKISWYNKAMPRVLLDPAERRRRADLSKRRWLAANYEYNKVQKRAIGARPAYLAIRRERYKERMLARPPKVAKPRKPRASRRAAE
jgi:hypothetical protein